MADMYLVTCSKCGYTTNIVLDGPPKEDTEVVCGTCKEQEEPGFISW